MNDEAKMAGIIGGTIIIVVGIIASATCIYYTQTTKAAIAAGLVQGMLPGKTDVYWVKPEKQ